MSNPGIPEVTLHYTTFSQITDDIDDARVYGGIHFRFDQKAGARLGRSVGSFILGVPLCAGDCDGGGTTTIDELISGVDIVLGTASLEGCPWFDAQRRRSGDRR